MVSPKYADKTDSNLITKYVSNISQATIGAFIYGTNPGNTNIPSVTSGYSIG